MQMKIRSSRPDRSTKLLLLMRLSVRVLQTTLPTNCTSNAIKKSEEEEDEVKSGPPIGRKAANRQREADVIGKTNMESAKSIARSLQVKAELEEEKNEMNMFALTP